MNFRFNNKNVYYHVQGEGKPIVLLHGFLESSTMWEGIVESLVQKFKVLIIDMPGHGKSEVQDETHSMELMAEIVHALMMHLKFEQALFLGHSMGGYVALAYAERFSSMMDGLLLLNSTAQNDSPERKENRNRALKLLEQERIGFISSAIPQLFSENSRAEYAKEIKELINQARSFPKLGIMANIRGMRDRKDRSEVLKDFNKPKMLISGINDPIIPIEHSKKLAITTNTPIEILPGSHMSWIENPSEIVKIVHFIENIGT